AQMAPASSAAQYFSFKVAPAAHMLPGNTRPQYPALLASAKVEGEVVVQFVVDPAGRVDTSSVRIVKTNHQLFANAVKEVAPEWKFAAAMADGHTVKQLVQVRVYFSLVPSAHLPPGSIEVTPTAK
ncbi:MAG: energy transducer TonB, partial [Gemmatimonadaceae bacterium]